MKIYEALNRPPQAGTGHGGANFASQRGSIDAFGRRLGIQGHIIALLSNASVVGCLKGIRTEDMVGVVRVMILIEDEVRNR